MLRKEVMSVITVNIFCNCKANPIQQYICNEGMQERLFQVIPFLQMMRNYSGHKFASSILHHFQYGKDFHLLCLLYLTEISNQRLQFNSNVLPLNYFLKVKQAGFVFPAEVAPNIL